MKNSKKNYFAGVFLLLGMTVMVGCDKEEPQPEPQVETETALPEEKVTTYDGELSYTPDSGMPILTDDGSATISKTGSSYKVSFSDGVPSLTGVKFEDSDGGYASISGSESFSGVSIDGTSLDIGVVKDGANWSFSGDY